MEILLDVDELRTISAVSVDAAIKMDEANAVITTVVSQHNWKCPERVKIDESLETIKGNFTELSNTFNDFASQITNIANACTDFINTKTRMETSYIEEISSLFSSFEMDNVISGSSRAVPICTDIANISLDTANIFSLHGAANPINLMDFSSFAE